MRPDTIMDNSIELGLCDIDQNYDQASNVRRRYNDIDFANLPNFIQNARNQYIAENDNVADYTVDSHTLNEKQKIVFERIESYYNALILNPGNTKLLNIIMIGIAEIGKSYLINMIHDRL